jgi:hypothetical protein
MAATAGGSAIAAEIEASETIRLVANIKAKTSKAIPIGAGAITSQMPTEVATPRPP